MPALAECSGEAGPSVTSGSGRSDIGVRRVLVGRVLLFSERTLVRQVNKPVAIDIARGDEMWPERGYGDGARECGIRIIGEGVHHGRIGRVWIDPGGELDDGRAASVLIKGCALPPVPPSAIRRVTPVIIKRDVGIIQPGIIQGEV